MIAISKTVLAPLSLSQVSTICKKSLLMLALTLCLFGVHGLSTEALAQNQTHGIANSDFAYAALCNEGCFDVQVSRVGSGQNIQTFLVYNYSRYDPSFGTYLYMFGSGVIPNADFKAPGVKITQHVLDTDTTNNSNFETFSYYQDPNTGQYVTLPNNRGRIFFEFEKNGQSSTTGNGSSVTKLYAGTPFAVTIRQTGLSDSTTARFKGSLLGMAFESEGGGSIGTYHQVTLIIERQ
jgi:hypothetical protein